MTRAAVLIGVNRTGGLPVLRDAVDGAKRMKDWALVQGMPADQVLLFTDENGQPVEVSPIRKAIRALVESGALEQLIVYFAGHGVNIRYGEYWLLSDAPIDPSAAVNVAGSVELARRCGIPHVVFISDACRTAAEGVQAQGVTGSEIFPNDPVGGVEQAVDIFFGTTLGRPALEVRDPEKSSTAFTAIYTDTLLEAISGRLPNAVRSGVPGMPHPFVVQPRPLKACLSSVLPERLAGRGVAATVSQIPDARITSDDGAWVAAFERIGNAPAGAKDPAPPATRVATRSAPGEDVESPPGGRIGSGSRGTFESVSGAALESQSGGLASVTAGFPASARAFESPFQRAEARLDAVLTSPPRSSSDNAASASRTRGAPPSGPAFGSVGVTGSPRAAARFDTQCGFVLHGARVAECIAAGVGLDLVWRDGRSLVQVAIDTPAADVLLVLDDGSGIVIPALREFVTTLSVVDGELSDVAYEPAEGTSLWDDFVAHAAELRRLRAVVADAAREGVFRLEGERAAAMARRMQYAKQIDPALGLYAAYAYHDLRLTDRIREIDAWLSASLGVSFFDPAMLTRTLPPDPPDRRGSHAPAFPMLSQGWALVSAFGVRLPDGLENIQSELLQSLWTHFGPYGVAQVRQALFSGRTR